jgi:hypothetical protein
MSDETEKILEERGRRYGPFEGHARITQAIKLKMACEPGWLRLTYSMKESLEMVAHKIGRILNGDPFYDDSWKDIAGYAELVAKQLTPKQATEVDQRTEGKLVVKRLSWDEVFIRLENLLVESGYGAHGKQHSLFGIPRGGAIVAAMAVSRWPKVFELVDKISDATIVVDDIVDSGETKARSVGGSGSKFFALVDKPRETIADCVWIKFPWEKEEELPEALRGA